MPRVEITARGHENVRAAHESTLELTTDSWLTPAGDCILGIDASAAAADFPEDVVTAAQRRESTVTLKLTVGTHTQSITGRGDPSLTFADSRSIVARTSEYVDDRTVMLDADTPAAGVSRALVAALSDGEDLTATYAVEP